MGPFEVDFGLKLRKKMLGFESYVPHRYVIADENLGFFQLLVEAGVPSKFQVANWNDMSNHQLDCIKFF